MDLRVTGTITPSACDISLAGGDVDYGNINGGTLNENATTSLTAIERTLNVVCTGATLVAIQAIDNRKGTSTATAGYQNVTYGLGLASSSNKIGHYTINLNDQIVDGAAGLPLTVRITVTLGVLTGVKTSF